MGDVPVDVVLTAEQVLRVLDSERERVLAELDDPATQAFVRAALTAEDLMTDDEVAEVLELGDMFDLRARIAIAAVKRRLSEVSPETR